MQEEDEIKDEPIEQEVKPLNDAKPEEISEIIPELIPEPAEEENIAFEETKVKPSQIEVSPELIPEPISEPIPKPSEKSEVEVKQDIKTEPEQEPEIKLEPIVDPNIKIVPTEESSNNIEAELPKTGQSNEREQVFKQEETKDTILEAQLPKVHEVDPRKIILEKLALIRPSALLERRKHRQENLEKIMGLALEFRKKNKYVTNDDVEKLLHVSDATASRYLSKLTKMGMLIRTGKDGGTKYEIIH